LDKLGGEILVPYRSQQQYFTNLNTVSPELPAVITRKKNATVKYGACCRSFDLLEALGKYDREWIVTIGCRVNENKAGILSGQR